METHEAIRKCIGRNTHQIAVMIGKSKYLVYKWQEPHCDGDSGLKSPLDRLIELMDVAKMVGQSDEDMTAPVYCLGSRYNIVCIPMSVIENHGAVGTELVKTIKEFSDLAQAASEALIDNRISPNEARRISEEGRHALRAINILLHVVQESIQLQK